MPRLPANFRVLRPALFLSVAALLTTLASDVLAANAAPAAAATPASAPAAAIKVPSLGDEGSMFVGRFLARPNKENFTALQNVIVAGHSYDQSARGLTDTAELYDHKQFRQALDKFRASQPDQLLSPQGHFYASRCCEQLGDKAGQKMEMAFVKACLQGLLATGDGSPERPFLVTHVTDEYDLLAAPLATESKKQSLVEKKGRWYDVLDCANGKTYWFDVTLTFGHKLPSSSPAEASDGTTSARSGSQPSASSPKPAAAVNAQRQPMQQPAVEPIPSRATQARAAYDRGVAAVNRRDYAQAINELDESIRLDTTSPDAFFERGFAEIESRNYGTAYVDFTDAIRLRSDYALAFYERGLVLRLEGDRKQIDNSIADFSEAIRLAPGDYLAWRNRAMVWFAKGDYQKSISDNSEAIMLRPDDATSYNNRGFAYESAGEYDKAVADFNQAIRLSPKSAEAYAGRGFAWVGRGEFDPAIADLDEAIRLKPDYAAAYAYRGAAFRHKGDEERARADEVKAASLRGTVVTVGR